jgi:hypothetical protein
MNADERKTLSLALHALEQLMFRTLALEALLEHNHIPDWKVLAERLASDANLHPEIRARFREVYSELERDRDDPDAMLQLLRSLPTPGKPN